VFELEVTNHSGGQIVDFDVMFNKNPFGLAIYNANQSFKYPLPGQTQKASIPCAIDKKNLDAKNPPKFPFHIQTALKSSLDVFYFEVPCMINCLIDFAHPMTRDDFKKFWEMIPKANET
jgi:AP-1 complex subunit beta-1